MRFSSPDRRAAIRWAAELLRRPDILFLDTETTGLDDDAEIIDIALVVGRGTVLLDTLVRPVGPIPAAATAVHRITDAMVWTAPSWPDVYQELVGIVRHRPHVIVYNAPFDRRVIGQTCQRHGMPLLRAHWHCAMQRYAAFVGERHPRYGDYRWHRLEEAARAVGALPPEHRALGDALACRAVVQAMASSR